MSLSQYLKDTRGELHHVSWPTRSQTITYTMLVIVISVMTALYLGAFDYIFSLSLDKTLEAQQQISAQAETPDIQVGSITAEGENADIQITPVEIPTQ